jgi:integrase
VGGGRSEYQTMPIKIVRRGKAGIWQIRGTVAGQRVRESTGTASQRHAEAARAKLEAELLDGAIYGKRRTATFAEAVVIYKTKGGSGRFLAPLNEHFGLTRMADIGDAEVSRFCSLHYPNAAPQTLNRQVYTPMIAVWRCAHASKLCGPHEFRRPKMPTTEAVVFARDEDLLKLLPACSERLGAAVMMISFTGARASEACRVEASDVDWNERSLILRRTKNGSPRKIVLAQLVYEALLPLRHTEGKLFGIADRFAFNKALELACKRAGMRVFTTHELGRHAFAARLLRQGQTLKGLQEAGGWSPASLPMLARVYGHLEQKAVDGAIRAADTDLARALRQVQENQRVGAA